MAGEYQKYASKSHSHKPIKGKGSYNRKKTKKEDIK